MRFDIIKINSGATVAMVRARFESVDEDADPVIVVRRQGMGLVTWHRISVGELRRIVAGTADDSDTISAHLILDAANEVDPYAIEEVREDSPPYGVVLLEGEAIAFSEGEYESTLTGPSRGSDSGPVAAARPPSSPQPETSPPSREEEIRTFAAHPVIEAPATVVAGEEFTVTAGLSATEVAETISTGLSTRVPPGQQTIVLDVLVTGPFRLVGGSSGGTIEVDVDTLEHRPHEVRFVTADPPDTYDPQVGLWTARVTAAYFHDGVLIGQGYREVRVNQLGARRITNESDDMPVETDTPELDAGDDRADLTISITTEEPGAAGRFRVRLSSRHLPAPVDAGQMFLGEDAAAFAARLVEEIDRNIANPVSDETLATVGRLIAEKLPDGVDDALRTVWEATQSEADPRVPDVLLLTDEWAVPWELMELSLDGSVPSFLGAQVNVGRWPEGRRQLLSHEPVGVRGLGVMVGHYQDARGVQPLPRAEEEAETLARLYRARQVNADPSALNQLLAGAVEGFEFEGLHFAGHGESDPTRGTYLMYSDGARMGVLAIGSASVARTRPSFLFVNACQVGTANEILGEYAGLAGLAIGAGFRGFVAPLWSVSDDVARDVSLGLYESSAGGSTVSSYLRGVRSRFREENDKPAHTTYMAYVYFGHPALRLGGPEQRSVE